MENIFKMCRSHNAIRNIYIYIHPVLCPALRFRPVNWIPITFRSSKKQSGAIRPAGGKHRLPIRVVRYRRKSATSRNVCPQSRKNRNEKRVEATRKTPPGRHGPSPVRYTNSFRSRFHHAHTVRKACKGSGPRDFRFAFFAGRFRTKIPITRRVEFSRDVYHNASLLLSRPKQRHQWGGGGPIIEVGATVHTLIAYLRETTSSAVPSHVPGGLGPRENVFPRNNCRRKRLENICRVVLPVLLPVAAHPCRTRFQHATRAIVSEAHSVSPLYSTTTRTSPDRFSR